ncbi:MAG: SDR family NAD(P)-dependent oxidoreductase [Candidatus Methanoperedens sp.]|nr:SDR family NAD(P)-dependent oxidoreductase [Candidatus Methanoperedens sp.]
MKLKNKVAIITGGAGGIGKTIVKYYLKEGASVIIAEINNLELEAMLNELNGEGINRMLGVTADITDIQQVKDLVKQTVSTFGTVDILVNVAGIQKPIGRLIEVNADEWIKNINTNLIGTMLCCKYVLPIMISKKKGKIINFSGGGATFPRPHFSAYASAKAAIVRFTETIAEEVNEFGIEINAISPGSVYTKMLEEIISAGAKSGEKDLTTAIKIKNNGGTPPEFPAELAVFLASSASDGITGKLISAVWDDWKNFGKNISEIKYSSLFTLRRVDGVKITEMRNEA